MLDGLLSTVLDCRQVAVVKIQPSLDRPTHAFRVKCEKPLSVRKEGMPNVLREKKRPATGLRGIQTVSRGLWALSTGSVEGLRSPVSPLNLGSVSFQTSYIQTVCYRYMV